MSDQNVNTPPKKRGGQPANQNAAKEPIPPMPKNQPPKKRGAPYGNNNAVTYGFYARRLPPKILEGLETTTEFSLKDEIDVMRVFVRKLAELGANIKDVDEARAHLNALSVATNAINRLVRTHTRIPDPANDPGRMLLNALEELEDEWPEYHEWVKDYPRYLQDPTDPLYQGSKPRPDPHQVIDLEPEDEDGSTA